MRIAIEVAMILMVTMVVRMTMMIAIKVPMISMITMVQWQAGADRKLKLAVANDFCFSIQFCKQPALELPQNRWPVWQTPQRHCGQSAPGWW